MSPFDWDPITKRLMGRLIPPDQAAPSPQAQTLSERTLNGGAAPNNPNNPNKPRSANSDNPTVDHAHSQPGTALIPSQIYSGSLPKAHTTHPTLLLDDEAAHHPNKTGQKLITTNTQIGFLPDNLNPSFYMDASTFTPEHDEPTYHQIAYDMGYPTVKGNPIWERLPGETADYFNAFRFYRDSPPQRDLSGVFNLFGGDLEVIGIVAKMWFWYQRAEAKDYFEELTREHNRQTQIRDLESKHSEFGDKLLQRAIDAIDHTERISPHLALEFARTAIALERLSKGLPPHTPAIKPSEVDEAAGVKKQTNIGEMNVQVNYTDKFFK